MHRYEHPRPAVTADAVIFAGPAPRHRVLLIRRKHPPFEGCWALPGGFVDMDEDLPQAAARELAEETGLQGIELHQLGAYGKPGRDPRDRVISVVYWGACAAAQPTAGSDAADVAWFDLDALPALAFDHAKILADARAALQSR